MFQHGPWDFYPVFLEEPVFCGKCLIEMKLINKKNFKCPNCGELYQPKKELQI